RVDLQGRPMAIERLARERAPVAFARGLEEDREAELDRELGRVVAREGAEGTEGADDDAARARVAFACILQFSADRRVEGARIGRVELEDARVGLRRVGLREAPFLDRREAPKRAETRA